MHLCGLSLPLCLNGNRFRQLQIADSLRDIVLHQRACPLRRNQAQDQNGRREPRLPQFQSLSQCRGCQVIRADTHGLPCDCQRPVPVGIRLDHRAKLQLWRHMIPYFPQIMPNGSQINLGPSPPICHLQPPFYNPIISLTIQSVPHDDTFAAKNSSSVPPSFPWEIA